MILIWFLCGAALAASIWTAARSSRLWVLLAAIGLLIALVAAYSRLGLGLAFGLPILVGAALAWRRRADADALLTSRDERQGLGGVSVLAEVTHVSGVPSWPPQLTLTVRLIPDALVLTPLDPQYKGLQIPRQAVAAPEIVNGVGRGSVEIPATIIEMRVGPPGLPAYHIRMSVVGSEREANSLRSEIVRWLYQSPGFGAPVSTT